MTIKAQFCGKPVVVTDVGWCERCCFWIIKQVSYESRQAAALAGGLRLPIEMNILENWNKSQGLDVENFSKQKEVENHEQLCQNLFTPKNIRHSAPQHV